MAIDDHRCFDLVLFGVLAGRIIREFRIDMDQQQANAAWVVLIEKLVQRGNIRVGDRTILHGEHEHGCLGVLVVKRVVHGRRECRGAPTSGHHAKREPLGTGSLKIRFSARSATE